jgi:hemin uptake protein HemP
MDDHKMKSGVPRVNGALSGATPNKKRRIESSHLFQGSNEIMIVHKDEEYNLRITRNGKLILTK